MEIAPRAENSGSQTFVRGADPVAGISLSANSEDFDDDFDALMNQEKALPSTPPRQDMRQHLPSPAPSLGGSNAGGSYGSSYGGDPQHASYGHASYGGDSYGDRKQEQSFRSLEEEKQHYLYKIQRMSSHGPVRNVSMDTPLDELKYEYSRMKRQVDLSASVKFQRRVLMASVTGLEFMNKRFNPFSLKLDGWSESQMDSIEDYDGVFERLHDKYSGTAEVAPEWELMMMLLGSGFMYHLSNTLFRSVLPNVNDIARQNPDLMANIANAMSSAMGQTPNAQSGDTVSQMGANVAMQAARNAMQQAQTEEQESTHQEFSQVPLQSTMADAMGALNFPQSTRNGDMSDDSVSEASSSQVSSIADLRNISGSQKKRGGRKKKANDDERVMDITL